MKTIKPTIKKQMCRLIAATLLVSAPTFSAIEFEDITSQAGLTRKAETWGASWGDMNGDFRPDIFVGNHRDRPSLYIANSDGTFSAAESYLDSSRIWLDNPLSTDHHGAAWADFDNDGDQDLFATTNGCCADQLMVNENNLFVDRSIELGLDDKGSGWSTAWFDYNFDGRLDNLLLYFAKDAIVELQQTDGSFSRTSAPTPAGCRTDNYAQFSDMNNDGVLDLICAKEGTFPQKVYDFSSGTGFTDISTLVPTVSNAIDSIVADFDGDLKADIFVLRGKMRPMDAVLVDPTHIEAWMDAGAHVKKSFKFNGTGEITLTIDTRDFDVAPRIHIGSAGNSPASGTFTLNSQDTSSQGLPNDTNLKGFYIGYDSALQQWTVLISPTDDYRGYVTVDSVSAMSNVVVEGLLSSEKPITPRLLVHTPSGIDEVFARGFDEPLACGGVSSGDFDNDMDVDIYLTCRHIFQNIENILYENQGDGTFVKVPGAGGAEGVLGMGVESRTGAAENIIVADYDVDGFLDLFVANGLKMRPTNASGPHQLFRNKGTSNNNWLLLDLVGTTSNRDGMGSKIYATAGGTTQLREQNGGYHRWSQDHQRIHFGLAANSTVDLRIEWPNGAVDNHFNIAANKLYSVVESGNISPVSLTPTPSPSLATGDECGDPQFDSRFDRFIYVWRDCATNDWHLTVSGGGDTELTSFAGSITSSLGFTYVNGSSLEADDILDTSNPNNLNFSLSTISNGFDSVNFSFPSGSSVCFSIGEGAEIRVGQHSKAGFAPLDLTTFTACSSLSASINDVTVTETAGSADFTVSLSEISNNTILIDYLSSSPAGANAATQDVDYAATAGVLSFVPGETSKTISVPIFTDSESEGQEVFIVTLTSSNIMLSDSVATGTIQDGVTGDISCGQPVYDAATEEAVFLWKDCTTGEWSMRVTAGGGTTALKYTGRVLNSQGFVATTPISFEGNDLLDNVTDTSIAEYFMQVIGIGEDGINFTPSTGSAACLMLDGPAGIPVLLGPGKQVAPMPLDLTTLAVCPASSGNECGMPSYDPGTEIGMFIWKDCLTGKWSVRVTGGGSSNVFKYTGAVLNENGFQGVVPYSYESNDILDATTDASRADYFMQVIGLGEDGFDLTPTPGTNACFTLAEPVGGNVWLGQNKQEITLPLDLHTISMCHTGGGNECGEPVFDAATETGVYLWKDCLADTWHMRASGGGSSLVVLYTGLLSSNAGFTSLDYFSIEDSDLLDQQSTFLDFKLKMIGAGVDGVDFSFPAGSNTCLDMTGSPMGSTVLLGAGKSPLTAPFDLVTQGACQ